MTNYTIWADRGVGAGQIYNIGTELQKCAGGTVKVLGIGPSVGQNYGLSGGEGTVGCFLTNGVGIATPNDFEMGCAPGGYYHYDHVIFIWSETIADNQYMSKEAIQTHIVPPEWDWNRDSAYNKGGQTAAEWFCQAQYVDLVYGETPAEIAKKICSGDLVCGSGTVSESSSSGAGGILYPDKTFWGLIKQIIGGIDGLFIIANNMAYLLSFKDYYKYRDKYDSFIPIIEKNDILDNTIEKSWTTDGFYNTVEVSFSGGVIRQSYDVLVNQYGEHVWYYDFPDDDEETAMAKADALLSAHIRDYSLDIRMRIVYNPNITVGGWVKVPKTITKVSKQEDNKQNSNQDEIKEKEDKIDIKDITTIMESIQKASPNNKYGIEKVVNNKNEQYEVITEESEYEIFFVQRYAFQWDNQHAPMMDIHLKYGPDTPEDPVNATIGGGAVMQTNAAGKYGNDCFTICDICIENCAKVLPAASGRREDAEQYIKAHEPDPQYLVGRARQGSTYVNDVAGKTSAEAYTLFRTKFGYACYWDSCDGAYPCCEDLWTKANAGNCGDATRMLKVLMDATGTPCYGIHVDHHYFNAVQVNGSWETLDGTRGPTNSSCGFPDSGTYGAGSNACGSGWCSG